MDNKIYTITLADGTVIHNLTINGNNYISKTKLVEDTFRDNCSPVTINDGTNDEVHPFMDLLQITENDGEYWLVLRDIPADELEKMQMKSDIEYLAMMGGVEL